MAEFLTTNGTSFHIENIIKEAKKKLVLVSPYLKLSRNFYDRLKDASNRGVSIFIIYGKDELHPSEMETIKSLKNVQLYYLSNLHAKIYFNESKMVITSMNMYEFSEKNNRETGVLIDKTVDKEMFDKAVEEVKSFMEAAELRKPFDSIPSVNKSTNSGLSGSRPQNKEIQTKGYCIRCESRIPFNPEKPYCYNCYNIWVQFENPNYNENVCHKCGKKSYYKHELSFR